MGKNSAKILANLVLNSRSNAFKELCEASYDSGIQSDEVAFSLRHEIATDLKHLLGGKNWNAISEKIIRHTAVPVLRIQSVVEPRRPESLNSTTTKIRLGATQAILVKSLPDDATAEQIVYRLLARVLETGEIRHLMLCDSCGELFYRKSLKGRFCCNDCRWAHFNSPDERHTRYERAVRKIHPVVKVTRRPRKKSSLKEQSKVPTFVRQN